MANFWENDPLVNNSEASAAPWENDKIVRSASLKRIGAAESNLQNIPNAEGASSATGLYQVTKGTFDLVRNKYPEYQDVSWDQFKKDPELQSEMAEKLRQDNLSILEKKNLPKDDLTQYTMWFSGSTKLAAAPADTPIEQVMSAQQIAANKLQGKTAGDVRAMLQANLDRGDKILSKEEGDTGAKPWLDDPIVGEAKAKFEKNREEKLKDVAKTIIAPLVSGIASVPEAGETGLRGASRKVFTAPTDVLNKLIEGDLLGGIAEHYGIKGKPVLPTVEPERNPLRDITEQMQPEIDKAYADAKIPGLSALSDLGEEKAKEIRESRSEEAKQALYNSEISGNIFEPESWSFGKKPSGYGIALQALEATSSMLPVIGTALLTKSPALATGVGGLMGAGEAGRTAKEYIDRMSDEELASKSPQFRDLSEKVGAKKARQIITDKASEDAAIAQGVISSIGSNITSKLVTGKFDDMLVNSVKNRAARIALGATAGAAEEGIEEVAEGIAADLGIDRYVARKIGADSFANLVLGALGGAGPGGVRGAVAKEKAPEKEVKEPTLAAEPVATPEEAAKFETAPEIEITGTAETKPAEEPVEATEKPLVAGQDTDVMMAELEGRLPKKEAEEVKAEAPVEEEAPKETVTMFKDYSPEDQKAIRTMEIEKNKIAKEKKLFPEFLRRQGIQPSEKADLGLEGISRPGIFKKNAPTFDELTSRAISEGFLLSTGDDVQDVENFREHVRDYIGSGIISTGPDVAREAQIGSIDDAIQEIARKYEKPAFGLEETTPAQLRADEEKRKAREAEAARIEAEDQARRDREEIARLSQSSEFALGKTAAEDLMGQKSVFDEPVAEEPAQPKTMKALAAKTDQLREELRDMPREGKTDLELQAMDIADRIESYGEQNFADGLRSAIRDGRIKTDKNLDFYRQREQEYAARVGRAEEAVSEKLSMADFMEGFENDQKRLREANELFATKTSDLLDKTNEYLQELVDVVNRRGYKFLDIDTTSPFDVQDVRRKISQIAGSMNLVLKQTEAFRKGYDRANEKKLEGAVVALTKDFKEADTIIDMSKQAEISKAEAEKRKTGAEDDDIPFFSVSTMGGKQKAAYPELKFSTDNPGGSWLEGEREYSKASGTKPSGAPKRFGATTGYFKRNVLIPVSVLAKIKGINSEQQNVREGSLTAIKEIMDKTDRLPQYDDEDYVPFINVDQSGTPYVNEGNHRIMAADALGFKYLPVEIRYYSGGEQESGVLSPNLVKKYDKEAFESGYSLDNYSRDIQSSAPSKEQLSKATMEQKKDAQLVADQFIGGSVVWQDGDLAIIRALNLFGSVVYNVAKGTRYWKTSIENLPAAAVNDAEKAKLIVIRDNIENESMKAYNDNPFIKFKDGSALSESVSKEIAGIASDWKKLLNIDANIYIAMLDDVKKNADKYTGPHREILNSLDGANNGVMKKMTDGDYYIVLKNTTNKTKMLETLAHELGHIHEKEVFNNAPKEMQEQLRQEHAKWLEQNKYKTAKEFAHLLRARTGAKTMNLNVIDTTLAKDVANFNSYWGSFSEWYADQVSRWAVSSEQPITAVEKFFKKLANALRKFYTTIKAQKYLPNETFKKYLEEASKNLDIRPLQDMNGQLTLFSKNEINQNTKHKTIFGEKALSTWTAPDESKLADFIYKVQDKNIDLKNVQKAITTQVGEIEDSWNAYQKEELYHGRTAKRIADFLKNELQPIVKELSKAGLSLKQFDDFLHNRHAEERNRQIAKINPLFPDGGSGIKTEDAKKYMDNLSPEDFAAMDKIASKIDKMVRETQDILVDNGLEDAETIKAWRKTYKHYAPLYRADLDFVHDSFGTGQGMSTRGGSTKRATGSEKEVVNIFANIAMQRERAIIRAEKARVGRALYGLAIKNPNADFWLPVNPDAIRDPKALAEELQSLGLSQADAVNFVKEPTTPEVDPNTGLVVNRIKLNSRYSDNVFAIRVNGKDRFIFFNPSNEEAMRLVKSFKNMDAEQLGIVLGTIGRITRFIAAMNTQYNPVFGAWNFTRDVGGAMVNLSTTPIADKKAKVMAGVFPALRGIYKDLRSERKGKAAPDNEWSKLWERYQNAGGQTGYRDQFAITPKNQVQQEQATEKTAKTLGKSMAQWLERKTKSKNIIEKEMAKLNQGNIKNTVDAVAGLLSDYNDAMENAVRLSAFKAALDKGLSEEQAASIAKNLTVNFNRKGQISTNMGALYAFFNASVQGTARIAETLAGPAGKKIIAGGMLLGVMQAVMLMMAGFDDDEPPEFLKDKNLIIPFGDGEYAVVPLPLGLAFIPALGRRITEAVVAGDKLPKRILGMMGAFADAFNPIGTGSFAQMLSPTVADPFVSVGMNKDSFGRPIYKEDRSTNPTPGYSRSRDGASSISKGIAEFLNWISSEKDTKYQKGEISPTADEIDYLAGQITGGVGRETQKAFETVKGLITGEEVEPHRKFVKGKIMGDINSKQAVSAKFYRNVTELAKLEAEVKGRAENQEDAYEVFKKTPKARLIDMANDAENDISNINKDIKEIKKRYPDNKEAVKRMEDAKLRIMRKLNARVKELEE